MLKAYVHMDQYPEESTCDCEMCASDEEGCGTTSAKMRVIEKKEGGRMWIHKDDQLVEVVDLGGKYKEVNGDATWISRKDGWVNIDTVDEQEDVSGAYHQRALEEAMASQQEQPKKEYECSICMDGIVPFDHRKCQGVIPYDCDECHDYYTDHRPCEWMTRSEMGYEDYCEEYRNNLGSH